jgi:kynurenine formamidase
MRNGSLLVCFLTLSLAGCQPAVEKPQLDIADIFDGRAGRWVDLTYAFASDTIYWPTGKPFELEEVSYGMSEKGYFYSSYDYSASEHGGTHFDAPVHFAEGAPSSDQVPIDRLIGPAVVVDVTESAAPDYQIQIADLEDWERRHGPIPDGAILLFRTGWGSRWPDPKRFLGTDRIGPEAVPELHFPGISPQAAQWLIDERKIDAIGIDTPSIDYGQSETFETHQILYAASIPGFENIANLGELPEAGSFVIALPMKIAGGSGGPLRMVAFIPG